MQIAMAILPRLNSSYRHHRVGTHPNISLRLLISRRQVLYIELHGVTSKHGASQQQQQLQQQQQWSSCERIISHWEWRSNYGPRTTSLATSVLDDKSIGMLRARVSRPTRRRTWRLHRVSTASWTARLHAAFDQLWPGQRPEEALVAARPFHHAVIYRRRSSLVNLVS